MKDNTLECNIFNPKDEYTKLMAKCNDMLSKDVYPTELKQTCMKATLERECQIAHVSFWPCCW